MADEVLAEVRRVRHEISLECHHEIREVAAYYRAFQEELKRSGRYRFFTPPKRELAASSMSGRQPPTSALNS